MKKFFGMLFLIMSVMMSSAWCFAVPGINPNMPVEKVAASCMGWVRWGCHFFAVIVFVFNFVIYKRIQEQIRVTDKNDKEKYDKLHCKEKKIKKWGMIVVPILLFLFGGIVDAFPTIDKPIIYLYPEQTQEISVKLGHEDKLIVSYPKYEESWEVRAEPNGDLIDLETGRKLYALYYESKAVGKFKVEAEGFVIKGEDSAKFLEEKLELLGLNYKEAEEFIVYWLPRLEANKYNYIRFASDEEIERNMPLEVSGNPDSVIRVMMTYKGLKRPIEVKEQEIITPERNGFVVVEWGGTEIR